MLLSSPLPPFALYSFLNSIELQEQGITKHLVVGRADGYNIIGGRRPTSRGTGDLAEKRPPQTVGSTSRRRMGQLPHHRIGKNRRRAVFFPGVDGHGSHRNCLQTYLNIGHFRSTSS